MKKAVGDLSSGLIAVIAVAILIAFFYYTIWPMIQSNFKAQTSCEKAICDKSHVVDGKVECRLPGSSETFLCNFKG